MPATVIKRCWSVRDAWVVFGIGVIDALHQGLGIIRAKKMHLVMWRRESAKAGATIAMDKICLLMAISPVELPEVKDLIVLVMSDMLMDDGGYGFIGWYVA